MQFLNGYIFYSFDDVIIFLSKPESPEVKVRKKYNYAKLLQNLSLFLEHFTVDKLPTPMEQAMCEVQLSRGQAANRATEAANQAAEANRQKLAAGAERDAIRAQVAAMKDAIDVARSLRGN